MVNSKQLSLELTLLVFIMSLFVIGVGIFGFIKIRESNNSSKELYTDRILPMDQLADIRFYTSNIIATARQIDGKKIAYNDALRKIVQSQDSIRINWKKYQKSYLTDQEKQLALNAKIQIDKSDRAIERLKLALKKEDANLLDSILKNELYPNLNLVVIEVSNLLRLQVKIGEAINQNNDSNYKTYTSEIIWIILIAFGFAVPFLYYLIKKNSAIVNNLKLNKAKLFLTEKNYRNLIEYAGEAILILNEETEIIDLNEEACTLFGYTREELLNINISELVPSDEIEKQAEDVALIRKDKFAQISRKIKRKDGSFIQTEISNRSMDGKGFFAILRDVTARKNAEEVIKKSEEKYRYLFDNNPAYIIIWDLETLEVLEINNAVLCKYGYSKEEWSRMSVLDYRPKEDYSKIEEFAKYMLVHDDPIVTRNWSHYKKNGDKMIMEIASHKIDYNNRKAILSLANDVTMQIKAEEKLKQSEEKHRVLTENISDAILLLDKEGKILYQSPSAERISGYSFEDVKEKSITEFLVSDELFRGQLFLKEILENPNMPKQNQFRINHKKGHEIWIEGTAINLLENESVKAIILNYRDVTDNKIFENELIRYNSELKKTNAELDRFVYSASHDLRAPLKSMLGLIYVTKECADPEDSELHERLAMLNNSVGKLDDFIEDILHYSRNARMGLDKDEINFGKIIEEIKGSHKFIEGIKGVQFHVEISSSGLFVSDYRRLGVVLNNLLSNALKYRDVSKEKSFVNIIIRSDKTNAVIVVEDNGVGIANNDKEKIFEMFYRATTLSSGSGLGLYIVKEALEKLEGTINVESEQDKGTKFIVEIPNQISNLN
ncbi:PAS domain S-box-containing protein [Flavobacterium glycines]|uniref:histidine kinase n=2 Tax=Flavobacterium glycines TaxID=551990 RepID=A0A511CMD9_9FLAO|nr:PAS domain S-box protein [Flavobacterium glycines]GEL11498.1 hybrid sensor histidine kinase/response regulator [Flavobacterium glycines]SDJ63019.1 PAS domain S-box-containing protein [Flavobacterium glycines]